MKRILLLTGILLIVLAGCQTAPSPTPLPPISTSIPIATPTPFVGSARVKLGDITMYFEVQGAGEPLILLHPGMSSGQAWSNQIPFFSIFYRVITLDSRGQGRTTDSDAPISDHLMAEDVVRLMDYLGIDSAYIVGWSDGGCIGIDLAIHHPDRVKALVAFAASINSGAFQEDILTFIKNASVSELKNTMNVGDAYLSMMPDPDRLPIILEKMRTNMLTEPSFTMEELASIKTPTLIMAGQRDEVIRPDHAKEIVAAISNSELLLFPDMGHGGPGEKPTEFNHAVLDFLKGK